MSRRRTAQEVAHVLREADRDLAKGLTVPDICQTVGIAQTTYYRWRQQYAPDQVDTDRRCRELELEVVRLKRLVAELLLDKQMLQDIAKKQCPDTKLKDRRFAIAPVKLGQENRPLLLRSCFPHHLASVQRLTLARWFSGCAIRQ